MQITEVSDGYAQQNPQKVYGLDESPIMDIWKLRFYYESV